MPRNKKPKEKSERLKETFRSLTENDEQLNVQDNPESRDETTDIRNPINQTRRISGDMKTGLTGSDDDGQSR